MSNGIGKNPLNDISKVYLEQIAAESAVPGKPAERLGAVTGIPKSEQESAAERIRKKTAEKKAALEKKHGMKMDDHPEYPKKKYVDEKLDPVGREDADIDNDGDVDKSDKYLHKRRKAIAKALASTKKGVRKEETEIVEIHSQAHTPHEIPSGDLKKLVKKAVKRIDTDVDGDTDKNDKAKGELGEFIPGVGNKRLYSSVRPKVSKESFSNWRGDLTEIMTDDIDSKPIKEKKVNNKIKINPKLGEAIEELGGTLIEMVEVSEENLSERGDFWHPDPEKDRKLGGPGANQRAREDRAGASSPKKDYSKTTKPGESYMQFAKRRQAEKAAAAKLRREDIEIDEAVKGQDTELRKAAAAERKAGDKRLSPSAGKANADKMERDIKFYDKVTKKTKPSVVGMTHEEVEQIDEKALSKQQQKFMGMVYAVKKGDMAAPSPEVAKAAAGMTKKQAKDFAKTKHKGLPQKKEVKEGATEAPMSPQELALQKRKTQIDQMIARKRQQSLQKANKPADKPVNESSEDRLRDQRMERGGVDGNTRYPSKPSGGGAKQTGKTWVQKQMEKKGKSALDIVKSEIRAKHGKGAILNN